MRTFVAFAEVFCSLRKSFFCRMNFESSSRSTRSYKNPLKFWKFRKKDKISNLIELSSIRACEKLITNRLENFQFIRKKNIYRNISYWIFRQFELFERKRLENWIINLINNQTPPLAFYIHFILHHFIVQYIPRA